MASLPKRIFHWGVTPELSHTFAKRVILTNILGFMFAFYMFLSALGFIYLQSYKLAFFTLFFVASELCWPVCNFYKKYDLARIGILIFSNLLGFWVSVLLPDTGYNRGFLVMAGLPILIFSLEEKKSILLGFLLPIVLYPMSEWAQHMILPMDHGFVLSGSMKTAISYMTGVIYVALVFLMFLFLSRENARAEKELQATLLKIESEKEKIETLILELEDERAKSFSTSKFAALGEMASGIAHEINNPMMVININTEHLKYALKDPAFEKEQAFQRIEVISRTVSRVAKIIDSMRNFSRVAERDQIQTESIAKIFDDTLAFCSERFKSHNIELNIVVPPDITVNCRSVQISQVILNLLNNAFDAILPLEEKWIRLEAVKDDNKKRVYIIVTDSGRGIPRPEREKIFQPFFTTKPAGKGTGLGLSLSSKILVDHGGSLSLDAKSANTKFIIELPL